MALVKCPECNGEVSDKARACPHCGYQIGSFSAQIRISNASAKSQPPIDPKTLTVGEQFKRGIFTGTTAAGIIGGILVFAIAMAMLFPRSGQIGGSREPQKIRLNCKASATTEFLLITNGDSFDYVDCRLSVNVLHRPSYETKVARIASGEEQTIPLVEFVSQEGNRFMPYSKAVKDLLLECHTPNGKSSIAWQFN